MYYCSYINFKGLLNSSIKADFIDEYLLKHNFDILFIINYKSNSLNFDVIYEGENVFIDKLEEEYNIYKGKITNNICNIIIIKKSLGNFTKIEKHFNNDFNNNFNNDFNNDFKVNPLQIYNKKLNLHLLCIDDSKSYVYDFIKKMNKVNNYIIGGNFNKKLNNIVNIDLEYNSVSNTNKIDEYNSNLGYDNEYKSYYLEKYKYGIIFNNQNFDNLVLRKTHIFDSNIIETILTHKYSNFKSINYLYNIFQNIREKLF